MGGSPERGTQYVRQTLNPSDQKILNLQRILGINLGQQARKSLSSPFTIDSDFELPTDLNANRDQVEQAYFDRTKNLLQPEFDRQQRREETALVNQGIPRGSEAFNDRYYDQLIDSQNRTLSDAALAAVQAGGAEQSRMFDLTQRGRQQDINDSLTQRTQPINELAAVLQGSQAIQSPNQASTPNYQIAPANVQGAVNTQYQGALNNFNNQNQNYQAGVGGLFGLGGSIASALPWGSWFSDMRMKTNIKPLMKGKYKWYTFNYLWDKTKRVGVIAQEVMKINPAAVTCEGGLYKVNYGEL
jgi:hypothetical protein